MFKISKIQGVLVGIIIGFSWCWIFFNTIKSPDKNDLPAIVSQVEIKSDSKEEKENNLLFGKYKRDLVQGAVDIEYFIPIPKNEILRNFTFDQLEKQNSLIFDEPNNNLRPHYIMYDQGVTWTSIKDVEMYESNTLGNTQSINICMRWSGSSMNHGGISDCETNVVDTDLNSELTLADLSKRLNYVRPESLMNAIKDYILSNARTFMQERQFNQEVMIEEIDRELETLFENSWVLDNDILTILTDSSWRYSNKVFPGGIKIPLSEITK